MNETIADEPVDKTSDQLGPEAKASLNKGVTHDID
jgi:hypothetical protein